MPPQLALLLTVGLIVYLFRRDFKAHPTVTSALWLPFAWMVLSGSRAVSEWLNLLGFSFGAVALEEGSPLDRLVYLGLISAGFYILRQRRVRLGQLMSDNRWLAAFLIYCLLAVLWSDFPFVAFKRWIKVVGHPIMVLLILSEPDPEKALSVVMRRSAYILLPISVLLIKYFPQYGRTYETWTGTPLYTGITTNKNLLGGDCFILGFFFVWSFLKVRRQPRSRARRNELIFLASFLLMIWWLLQKSHSKTSLSALLIGTALLLISGWKSIRPSQLGGVLAGGVVVIGLLQLIFDLYGTALGLLGRDATLTERTFLWRDLLRVDINPLLGAGFESFWLGERLQKLWRIYPWQPNQAHNGYLETYINLGLVGLFILLGLLFITYRKALNEIPRNFEHGRFRLGFLFAIIAYNWTEASFKTTGFLFFAFYLIAIDYRKPAIRPGRSVGPKLPDEGARFSELQGMGSQGSALQRI